jgi:integral membrane protein
MQFGSVEGALRRYQLMAYIVGTGLLVLVFVGIPLQIWDHSKEVVAIVGPLHGYLYLIYLATAFDLARRARFSFARLLVMISAGLVPFVAFVIERKISMTMSLEHREHTTVNTER